MCRYAEDLLPMYTIMAAPETDALKLDEKVEILRVVGLHGLLSMCYRKAETKGSFREHRGSFFI